jgi:uncharacterized protein (DUF433 family)
MTGMRSSSAGVQRSFRLAPKTLELLDREAEESNTSRNALADRLLAEGLRMEHHPQIRFQTTGSGRRVPMLAGTRLKVYHVISTIRDSDGSLEEAAEYFSLPLLLMEAARDYYADFREEVDAQWEEADRIAARERARWERQQRALS